MPVRIFTIGFDPLQQVFQDEELSAFLLNKVVRRMQTEFFQHNGHPYWTVFVEYGDGVKLAVSDKNQLDEPGLLLLKRLSQWRKETAEREKVPVFIIATNRQLTEVVRQAPDSLEALRSINGFGKKKLERYGDQILKIIHAFHEKRPIQPKKGEAVR